MDFGTPCRVLLGLLLAAIALSVLGLAADNIAYVNTHKGVSPIAIHYTRWNEEAKGQYSYWVTMNYLPSQFSVGPMVAMIVACIVSVIVGIGAAAGSWVMRGKKTLETGASPYKHYMPLFPVVLNAIAFLTSLAVTAYLWRPVAQSDADFRSSLPVPPPVSASHRQPPVVFQSSSAYTPEVWNCMLAPYVVQPGPSRKLQSLCREAGVAKDLMVVMLLLSAALLTSLLWAWRSSRLAAARSETENVKQVDVEEISVQTKE